MGRGATLIEGANGNGKTNLLESIYMLSIGRSPRTSADRDVVRTQAFEEYQTYAQVVGDVAGRSGEAQLQIDFATAAAGAARVTSGRRRRVQKRFRVNGVARKSAEFVGILKAVLFAVEDVRLAAGPPSGRRRFLDILASQLDQTYLADVLEYNRVVTQRNHLLKSLRSRRGAAGELEFWDDRMSTHAARIMAARSKIIGDLGAAARPIHSQLSGSGDDLTLAYGPSVEAADYADVGGLSRAMLDAVRLNREREIRAGHGLAGPQLDDLRMSIGDMDIGAFGSRGQSRTAVLALKLAEAQLLDELSGDQPVILLDDVASELDETRRGRVLDRLSSYEQVLVTTAEPSLAASFGERDKRHVRIESGQVTEFD